MLDFNSNQIEKHFAQNAIFKMEFAAIKLKLNMQTLFNTNFHFDRSIVIWFSLNIGNNEFFFFRDSIIVSIDHNIYIVSQSNHNSVVAFELFFYTIELKIIRNIICQCTRWLKISNNLQEG